MGCVCAPLLFPSDSQTSAEGVRPCQECSFCAPPSVGGGPDGGWRALNAWGISRGWLGPAAGSVCQWGGGEPSWGPRGRARAQLQCGAQGAQAKPCDGALSSPTGYIREALPSQVTLLCARWDGRRPGGLRTWGPGTSVLSPVGVWCRVHGWLLDHVSAHRHGGGWICFSGNPVF